MDESNGIAIHERIQRLTALTSRASWMSRLGQSYGGDRDVYQALGYKDNLTFEDFAAQYRRQDIANAVINKPVGATWRGPVKITESGDDEDTPLEKAWKMLNKDHSIKQVLQRADRLSCIGMYGALFIGFDDVDTPMKFAQAVSGGSRKLSYLKPLSEQSCQISAWEVDPKNPRYGLPDMYNVTFGVQQDVSIGIKVHHTRILHISGLLLESEVYGVPVLEPIFNRLKDLEKIVGGSGEMFWRGARPGYQGKVDPEYTMSATEETRMKEQLDEYENHLRRILTAQGISYEALESQVSDPSAHVDVQIQMISAQTGIPKRILTGSERGELASSQDSDHWSDMIDARRYEYAEPCIIRPFVDRLIEYGVLPKASDEMGYAVEFDKLYDTSEKEKAEISRILSTAVKEYGSLITSQDLIPQDAYFKLIMGFSEDDIALIHKQQETAMAQEEADFREEQEGFELDRTELEARRTADASVLDRATAKEKSLSEVQRNKGKAPTGRKTP